MMLKSLHFSAEGQAPIGRSGPDTCDIFLNKFYVQLLEAIGVALYRVQQHVLQARLRMLSSTIFSCPYHFCKFEVVYVGVLPEFRRQHVGRALVAA